MPVRNEGLVGDFLLEIVHNPGGDDCILDGGSSNVQWENRRSHGHPTGKKITEQIRASKNSKFHKRTDSHETCI